MKRLANRIFSRRSDKRGMAIETALTFMVVMFLLCSLITAVSINARKRNVTFARESNDSFLLDQIGDYFISALGGGASVDFKKDVEDEESTEYVRGGWVKFIVEDPTADKMSTLDTWVFGLNFGNNGNISTMRVAYWGNIPEDGNLTDTSKIILYVTAQQDAAGNIRIYNWSDQPLRYTVKDASAARDLSFFQRLLQLIGRIIESAFRIIRQIFGI